jgi:hypothetical protein
MYEVRILRRAIKDIADLGDSRKALCAPLRWPDTVQSGVLQSQTIGGRSCC